MAEEKPNRRLSLLERSSRSDIPKFRVPAPPTPTGPSRKRVSFAESEDVRVFEVERSPSPPMGSIWLSSLVISRPDEEESDASSEAAESSEAAQQHSLGVVVSDMKRKSKLPPIEEPPDEDSASGRSKDWMAEHGQDLHDEWSHISMAAQKKVHEAGRRHSRRLSLTPRRSSVGLIPVGIMPGGAASVPGKLADQEPKKKKTKKKKKKKKKGKKKKKKLSVMAFLRGSIKRTSKAKVDQALKKMMRRIIKKVKKKHDKMAAADKALKVRNATGQKQKKKKKKKQLYTVKKIRGRNVGLKSLLRQWKWVFIFS